MLKLKAFTAKLRAESARLHAIASDPNQPWVARLAAQAGSVSVDTLLMVFVLIIILFQLGPMISSQNVGIQASTNMSAMGKWAYGLGEWLFPLLGIIAIVFMLWRRKAGGKHGSGAGT